jgi:hypothetical protein
MKRNREVSFKPENKKTKPNRIAPFNTQQNETGGFACRGVERTFIYFLKLVEYYPDDNV